MQRKKYKNYQIYLHCTNSVDSLKFVEKLLMMKKLLKLCKNMEVYEKLIVKEF